MRHDVIHDMHCDCMRCAIAQGRPAIEPEDIAAIRKGLIAGVWIGGLAAANKFGPSLLDWIMQR